MIKNTCVSCGEIIPEGTQICEGCKTKYDVKEIHRENEVVECNKNKKIRKLINIANFRLGFMLSLMVIGFRRVIVDLVENFIVGLIHLMIWIVISFFVGFMFNKLTVKLGI